MDKIEKLVKASIRSLIEALPGNYNGNTVRMLLELAETTLDGHLPPKELTRAATAAAISFALRPAEKTNPLADFLPQFENTIVLHHKNSSEKPPLTPHYYLRIMVMQLAYDVMRNDTASAKIHAMHLAREV